MPPLRANRHVPWIMGIGGIALGLWFLLTQPTWWQFILGCLFLAFGWYSIKTALFASDRELAELTGETMSEETKRRAVDRM